MEVRKDYKQSEVGVIPEDWEVFILKNLSSRIGDGIHSTPKYSDNSDYFFVNGNNLKEGKIFISADTKMVSEDEFNIQKRGLDDSTLLLSINGTIGNIAYYNNENIVLGKSAAYINVNNKLEKRLLFQILQTKFIDEYFENELTGSTIKNLGLGSIRNTPIPLPPTKSEQTAIAIALNDADALISSLEKLIEKKRAIKQGAMQELLKPKEGWEVKKFGEIIVEFRGGAPFAPSDFKESGFKVLPKGGVGRGGILSIDSNKQQYCSNEYAANHQTNIVDNKYNIVVLRDLVPSGPSIGLTVKFDTTDRYVLAQGVYGYKVNEDQNSSDYLIQLSNTKWYRKIMNNIMVGSTQVHISNSAFLKVSFSFPPTKLEQTRIATILSDMDAEITALEQKLAKYKQIKQGMMQELLTGRIRLVEIV